MVNEVTMICMDTSSWMEHSTSYRFFCQIDAIGVYCEKYFQSHPENYVGVMAMGGKNPSGLDTSVFPYLTRVVVEPTKDLSLIMSEVRDFKNVGGATLLETPLIMGSFYLNEKHENLLKRMVVFAGGPLRDCNDLYTRLGTKLKNWGVAVDVVNYGDQQLGYNKHQLLVLLAVVNNNDNTRMLDLCGHHLDGSSVIPLVGGQGERCFYSVYLLQGEDLRKAKNQCDKVHGVTNAGIGYLFRGFKLKRLIIDERRKIYNRVRDGRKLKVRAWDGGERYYRCHDDERGRERYWDRGDRYGRKREYRVCDDEGRERYRVALCRKLKRDDTGKERYLDRGDSFQYLEPTGGGNHDTWNRKRKRDDRGHDHEGRERYRG